ARSDACVPRSTIVPASSTNANVFTGPSNDVRRGHRPSLRSRCPSCYKRGAASSSSVCGLSLCHIRAIPSLDVRSPHLHARYNVSEPLPHAHALPPSQPKPILFASGDTKATATLSSSATAHRAALSISLRHVRGAPRQSPPVLRHGSAAV